MEAKEIESKLTGSPHISNVFWEAWLQTYGKGSSVPGFFTFNGYKVTIEKEND